jgi:hypothetical protein
MDLSGADQVDEQGFKPRKTGLIVAVLLGLVVVAAGAAFLVPRPTREPLRVLVAVDAEGQWWEGSTTAARLLDNVAPHLKRLGFEPVDGGDPAVLKKLEGAVSPEDAAKRIGASFIVSGPIKVEVTDLGKDAGMIEVRATGKLKLSHVDGGDKALGAVVTWSGAPEKAQALKLAAQSLGWQVFDLLLPGLMTHDAVKAIVKSNDAIAAGKLTAAKSYLDKRASQLDFVKAEYSRLTERFKQADKSPSKISLHTPLHHHDGLCATGAAGFFAKSSVIVPFFSPATETVGYFQELEQLFWQSGNAAPRRVFEGYNVLGYASASPDGTAAAYVEDLYGAATALNVVAGSSASRRVFMNPKLRLSEPKVAPGGALAAVWARECSRCPPAVLVVDLKSGQAAYKSDPKRETLGGFVWLGPTRLGVLVRAVEDTPATAAAAEGGEDGPSGPSQNFHGVQLDVQPASVTVLGSVSGDARLSLPSASADASRVVFQRGAGDGMDLALYDNKTSKLEPLAVEGAHDPALSPNGEKVAYVVDGDILVYDIASKNTQRLTETGDDFTLRYPQFALDGNSVYFEVRARDPVFPKERMLTAIGSTQVR